MAFRIFSVFVLLTLITSVGRVEAQALGNVDTKKIQRFCDVGFRFVEDGIQFDLTKLFGLGLKVDPKVLQALSSQAAVQIAALTQLCHFTAAGMLTPQEFVAEVQKTLNYAKDLEALREKSESDARTPVTKKVDPQLDPAAVGKAELGLTVQSSIDVGGELRVVLARLAQRYSCVCLSEKKTQ